MTMAQQFGASPAVVGILYATLPICTLVSKPLCGSIADKFQQKKSVLLASMLLMYCAALASYFIPLNVKDSQSTIVTCDRLVVTIPCPMPFSSNAFSSSSSSGTSQVNSSLTCSFTCHVSTVALKDICRDSQFFCPSSDNVSLPYVSQFHTIVSKRNLTEISHVKGDCQVQLLSPSSPALKIGHPTTGCDNVTVIPCEIHCDGNTLEYHNSSSGRTFREEEEDAFRVTSQVALLWICMLSLWFGLASAVTIGDAVVIGLLKNSSHYGRQRLWGSVGWGSLSVLAGYLVDLGSRGKNYNDFSLGYCVVLVCGLLDLTLVYFIKVENSEKPKQLLKNVGGLLLNPRVVTFALAVFLVGCFHGTLSVFLIVYLNELRATQLLIGLVLAAQAVLGEIPFFFFSNWFLKKIGHVNAMVLVLAVFGLRFLAYSLISNPWTVLPVELTHGITFGLFYTALATYPSQFAPPNLQATLQGILQAVFEGLGKYS